MSHYTGSVMGLYFFKFRVKYCFLFFPREHFVTQADILLVPSLPFFSPELVCHQEMDRNLISTLIKDSSKEGAVMK